MRRRSNAFVTHFFENARHVTQGVVRFHHTSADPRADMHASSRRVSVCVRHKSVQGLF